MAAPKFLWELMRILSFLALCKADMTLCLHLFTVLVSIYCACTYLLCLYLRIVSMFIIALEQLDIWFDLFNLQVQWSWLAPRPLKSNE